jgi:hypothetical protein
MRYKQINEWQREKEAKQEKRTGTKKVLSSRNQ